MIKTEYYCDLCGGRIMTGNFDKSQIFTVSWRRTGLQHYHKCCVLQVEKVCKALGFRTHLIPASPLSNGFLTVEGHTY